MAGGPAPTVAAAAGLLAVARQHLLACLGELLAILLQAGQNHEIALIHQLAAKARDITGAGILLLLGSAAPLMLRIGGGHDECKRQSRAKSQKLQRFIPSSSGRPVRGRRRMLPTKTHEKCG